VIGQVLTNTGLSPRLDQPSSQFTRGCFFPAADARFTARVTAYSRYFILSFADLGLSQPVLDALAHAKYSTPTPIQRQAIPTVLTGRDLLGIAQTGTGKTAAFVLPSLDRLAANRTYLKPGQIRMLVLAPTRELAAQIAASARAYGRFMKLSVGVVFGGVSNHKSVREVSRGLDVLVATPGRLLDLVDQRALSLRDLEVLVLDEADQMLDLGFIHALKRIVALVPPKRQTLFFSATMPRAIKELADRYLTNPAEVSVAPAATTVERVVQSVTMVNQAEKAALLTHYLQTNEIERALVFSRTKHGADKIVRWMIGAGIDANAIHGNKSQPQRERAISLFKSGQVKVMVATDIAARGIDIPGVSHVVNFDLPDVPEQYVHRIGRTARAGADGIAIAFCSPDERGNLRDIERTTRQKLATAPLPDGFAAALEAFKRLKPAPRAPERSERPFTKGDRRHDGQRRQHRNDGQRHPHRADGHAAHRSGAQDRNGVRRDDQRNEGGQRQQPRRDGPSSYRPEVHREAGSPDRRPAARSDQRPAQPGGDRGGFRPNGGQPKRKFGGGRGRPAGPHRARG